MFTARCTAVSLLLTIGLIPTWYVPEYKLAVDHKSSLGELYDLVHDPRKRAICGTIPVAVKAEMLLRLSRQAFTADPCRRMRGRGKSS